MVTVKSIKIDEKGRIDAIIKTLLLSLKSEDREKIKGEHRHRRRSHHKPRHHNENGEAPKNLINQETKEQIERMTENQELQAFDETLRGTKEPDHFWPVWLWLITYNMLPSWLLRPLRS